MISVIIPTHNEEKYLPKLLRCIKKQTYKDYEIIVCDGNSEDNTLKIAKDFGCGIVKGFPKGCGAGRNKGAKVAKGDILLFLDADSQIGNKFLENAIKEIDKRDIDAAGTFISPLSNKIIDKIFLAIFNSWIFLFQFISPHAVGTGVFCKKWLHEKVKGFNERLFAEDMDYVKRCGKYGKFRILKSAKVHFSMRRFNIENRWSLGFRIMLAAFYRIIFGEIKDTSIRYNLRYKK